MTKRQACQLVEQALARQAAVALIGARQVGKTTLAIEIGENSKSHISTSNPEPTATSLQIPFCFSRATKTD